MRGADHLRQLFDGPPRRLDGLLGRDFHYRRFDRQLFDGPPRRLDVRLASR